MVIPKKLSLQEWKARTQTCSTEVGCPDDLWDTDDPYELKVVAPEAYATGVSPEEFVRDVFADDLAAREGEEQELADSWLLNEDLDE